MTQPSMAQQKWILQYKRQKFLVQFLRILLFFFFIAIWELTAQLGLLNDFIFSSPSRIVLCFADMLKSGELLSHLWVSIYETLISLVVVTIFGILFALLLWLSPMLHQVLEPFLVVLNSLPKSALAPVLIVWLGSNQTTIIVAAVSVGIFGSILTLYASFAGTDPDQAKLITTLGGNRFHILSKVILPSNIPVIISNMKVNVGLCLVGVIIGEFLAARAGLGYLIIYGSQVFQMDIVIMSIAILCVLAILLYQFIGILEKLVRRKH